MDLIDIYKRAAWRDKLQKAVAKMRETGNYWTCTYAPDAPEQNMETYRLTDFQPSILQTHDEDDFIKLGISKEELAYYNSQVK